MNDTISLWIATAIAAAFTFAIVFALLSIMPAHAAAAVDWRARRGADGSWIPKEYRRPWVPA
jgi:hypothetical protein